MTIRIPSPRFLGLALTALIVLTSGRWAGSAEIDPVSRPVRLMINWDEQGMWMSQLQQRRKHKQPLDAASVRRVIQTALDEHARAGFDRLAYCAWVRFESPVPGFKTCDFDKGIHTRAPGFQALHEAGDNQLAILLKRCRRNQMQFLVCLRMNDRHGVARTAKFYVENPGLRLEEFPGGLDFKHKKVRDGVLAFIREVLELYDIDGIELDYLRWCHMFRTDEAVQNAPLLTEMTRKARAIIDAAARKRGRSKLLLSVRVPQTLAECHRLGFDVKTWIKEGLVDYVCPSDFFFSDFNMRVDRFVSLCKGTACRVYPAIHPLVQVNFPENITPANYRALARSYYAAGAAGIATYNYQYNWRRWTGGTRGLVDGWPKTLRWMTQLRDPKTLAARDRHYLFYPLWQNRSPSGAVKYDRCVINRKSGTADGDLRLRLYENDAGVPRTLSMQFRALGLEDADRLTVAVNGNRVPTDSIRRTFDRDGLAADEGRPCGPFHLHEFPLRHDWLRPGDNSLAVSLAKRSDKGAAEIVVWEVEIRVKPRR